MRAKLDISSHYTRRNFAKIAIGTSAAATAPSLIAKPNSNFHGVHVGINAPYSFHGMPGGADDVLRYLLELGLSTVELRSQPIEAAFGAPMPVRLRRNPPPTPEDRAKAKATADALEKWRLSAKIDQFQSFRKKWNDAGVQIDIVKFDGVDQMKDEVVDYAFRLAKAVGARAISCEIPVSKTKWLGEFAANHKFMVGYHGHAAVNNPEAFAAPSSWERAMSYSKYNGINLDIGHFIAGNNTSPIPFLKKYADRVTHIHLKDRKMHEGPNRPWGEGDTPIREVLQLMKKEKYPFQATIEFEYQVPQGSTLMKEVAKCIQFCKDSLA